MSMIVLNVSEHIFSGKEEAQYAVSGKIYVKRKVKRNCLQVSVKMFNGVGKKTFFLENFSFNKNNSNLNKLYGAIRHAHQDLKGKQLKLHSGKKEDILL